MIIGRMNADIGGVSGLLLSTGRGSAQLLRPCGEYVVVSETRI